LARTTIIARTISSSLTSGPRPWRGPFLKVFSWRLSRKSRLLGAPGWPAGIGSVESGSPKKIGVWRPDPAPRLKK
jgi:hypothetical protein